MIAVVRDPITAGSFVVDIAFNTSESLNHQTSNTLTYWGAMFNDLGGRKWHSPAERARVSCFSVQRYCY